MTRICLSTILVLLALPLSSPAQQTIYRCIVDQQVIFSQTPCSDNAKEITLKTPEKMFSGNSSNQKEQLNSIKKRSTELERSRLVRHYRLVIKTTQKELKGLEEEKTQKLNQLYAEQYNGNMQQYYSVEYFEKKKARKIKQIKNKYNARISRLKKKLEQAREKLDQIRQ